MSAVTEKEIRCPKCARFLFTVAGGDVAGDDWFEAEVVISMKCPNRQCEYHKNYIYTSVLIEGEESPNRK